MTLTQVVPGVYQISLGFVNAFLLKEDQKLVLIDAGMPGSTEKIVTAAGQLGHQPEDIEHILITHLHGDHTGSLPEIKKLSNATTYMHPLDARMIQRGEVMRPTKPAPGIINQLIVRLLMSRQPPIKIEPVEIDQALSGGEVLDFANGLQVVFTPGHSAGHISFLSAQNDGLLFAGDAASNMMRLGYPPIFEDLAQGEQSLARLAKLDFEMACFGHGKPILNNAAQKFQAKWGAH